MLAIYLYTQGTTLVNLGLCLHILVMERLMQTVLELVSLQLQKGCNDHDVLLGICAPQSNLSLYI